MLALGGAGSRLPTAVLTIAGLATLVAVIVSGMSIHLQFRNYRKPALQRYVAMNDVRHARSVLKPSLEWSCGL
jgi:hypothetical protein